MATYYVREQGAMVQKVDQRLVVTKDGKEAARIPLHDLDQLVLMGNVQITTQAMKAVWRAGVDVVFTSALGKPEGIGTTDEAKYAALRVRQLQVLNDRAMALSLAKQIVLGKLLNQEAVLQSKGVALPAALSPVDEAGSIGDAGMKPGPARVTGNLSEATRGIRDMLARGMNALDADSLRGFEGKAATYYWPAFGRLLKRDMGFKGRAYRPSPDPVNALLSFGYALLQKDVTAAAKRAGLDPYIGFFHAVQDNRPSLMLDLMEEFRPVVVDALVLALIGRDAIAPADFVPNGEAGGFTLKEAPVRRVIEAYEARLEQRVRYGLRGENLTLRQCIEQQAWQLVRVIRGEAGEFVPVAAM